MNDNKVGTSSFCNSDVLIIIVVVGVIFYMLRQKVERFNETALCGQVQLQVFPYFPGYLVIFSKE